MEILTQRELPAVGSAITPAGEQQIPLFGTSDPPARLIQETAPLAAAADPIMSHLAATELTGSGRREAREAAIVAWLRANGSAFASTEIARAADLDCYIVARQRPDLERDGLVERCGMRVCTASGSPAISWRIQ